MQIKNFERYPYYIVCIVEWKKERAKLFMQYLLILPQPIWASQVVLMVKNPPANAEDARNSGSIPGSGNPLE